MKKRILLTYAMYGNGHRAVAQYIESYFKAQDPELEILANPHSRIKRIDNNKGDNVANKSFIKTPSLLIILIQIIL